MKAKLPTTLGDLTLGATKKCPGGMILRKGYKTRRGVKVGPACVPAGPTGRKRLPHERILPKPKPGATGGWSKDLPDKDRRAVLKKLSEKEGCATAIRKMTLLRNITADPETKGKAKADADWLAKQGFCELKSKDDR